MTEIAVRRLFGVVNGGTPTGDEANWNGAVPWATPVDLAAVDGRSIAMTARTLTRVGVQSGSATVPKGSLLLSTRAPIGYVAATTAETAFNQGCRGLVPRVELDLRFFRYQLRARRDELVSRGQGSTFTELSSESLAAFKVRCPEPSEQRAIADFLDAETARIDALIDKKRRLAAKLGERLAIQVEAELRSIASDRGEIPLRHLADVTVGIVVTPARYYADEGVPALRGVNVLPGRLSSDDLVHITAEGHALHPKSQLRAGDVVTVRTGQAGATAVVPPEFDGANCIDLLITRPRPGLSPRFLELVINSDWCAKHIAQHAVGALQGHFNVGALKNLPIPRAHITMQTALVARTSAHREQVDRLLGALRVQVERLLEHRQALIISAVTGQFDVAKAVG